METYNERRRAIDEYTVKTITISGDDATVLTTDSTGFGTEARYVEGLEAGSAFELETIGFSLITGLRVGGVWLFRKSDQQLAHEHDEMVEGFRRREREQLEANREQWGAREAALPEWLRVRLQSFHESGGENFELQGWGYELVVCELAALYFDDAPNFGDTDAVMEYANREGTSGNQHGMARALARAHLTDPAMSMAGTVSALAPLTGNADYSNGGR